MCSTSVVGGEESEWCGTGWTGQPAVWELDGRPVVAFGAFDRRVHLLEASTGEPVVAPFRTGDIVKGSVTVDPDGYPLIYVGSRDNRLRVLSFDRGELVELWALDADEIPGGRWNDDWDGAPLVIDDYLFEGGENSLFHIVRLNRGVDEAGFVNVDPELLFALPGYDDDLIGAVGGNVSIESSVAISGDTVYFANSGGLVQGWSIEGLARGDEPTRVFRYWAGDDIDASIVIDEDGNLYLGAEYERGTARSREVGQIFKLDPSQFDPLVWSVVDRDGFPSGVWATPAVYGDVVFASTNAGRLMGIERDTGAVLWEKRLPGPLWSSQTVVDDVLFQGDCEGILHAFDVSDPTVDPPELWAVQVGGCIESSPTVWRGRIYVGTRGGRFHAIGDPSPVG